MVVTLDELAGLGIAFTSLNDGTDRSRASALGDSPKGRAKVMELVEGPTLADRVARWPIPVDEALP